VDSTLLVQLFAVVLFSACLFHSWRIEGRRAAQQWFLVGYIFALLLINLLVVSGQLAYNPAMLVIGAAPSLTIMLFPAVLYLAYSLAGRLTLSTRLRATAYLVFLIVPVFMLPLDATALQLGWWNFPSDSFSFVGGVPFYLPFAWGAAGACFFLVVGRIRKIRFRGSGQFFAMIIAAPLLAIGVFFLIALIQVLVDVLAALGGATALYVLVGLLFGGLPLALVFNFPRLDDTMTARPALRRK
jgi:hypothetical protein